MWWDQQNGCRPLFRSHILLPLHPNPIGSEEVDGVYAVKVNQRRYVEGLEVFPIPDCVEVAPREFERGKAINQELHQLLHGGVVASYVTLT